MPWSTRSRWRQALSIATSVLVASCGPVPPASPPSIVFNTVPEAAPGGSEKLALMAGRAVGARPDDRIVLFAKSSVGVWCVQPLTAEPFTRIESDTTWKNTIHLGIEYAALLVRPSYRPPDTTEVLPTQGGDVIAIATIKGRGEFVVPPPKRLSFSGYEWDVRQTPSDRGGANEYAADNAWTDAAGLLHLSLRQRHGQWTSAEVTLNRTLGYGTYLFVVRDTSRLDPAAAIGMLTYDQGSADQNHRELSVEISQWGDPSVSNAQYVVQPYYVPANVSRFAVPAGTVSHSFRWEPGRAVFRTSRGSGTATAKPAIAQHEFASGVPTPGSERVQIHLYFFRYSPRPPEGDVEVVIERFQYFP
jgi:hypothetical protein